MSCHHDRRMVLYVLIIWVLLCGACAGTLKAGEIGADRSDLVAVDEEHHGKTEPQDTTATTNLSPTGSESTSAHEGEADEPDNTDYWRKPWRIPESSNYLLKRRSIKLALFILICYVYLKRNDIRYFLSRKKAEKR
jgi:hypothetical protein